VKSAIGKGSAVLPKGRASRGFVSILSRLSVLASAMIAISSTVFAITIAAVAYASLRPQQGAAARR